MKVLPRVVTAAAVALAMSIAATSAVSAAPAKPSRPSSLKAVAGDERVSLSWVQPTLHNPPINYYTVKWSPGGGSAQPTSTSLVVPNLTNGTTYTFTVTATNDLGTGPASLPASATPRAIPPSAPNNIAATQGPAAGQYTFSWTPPSTNGSSPSGSTPSIDHYNIALNPGGIRDTVSPTTTTYVASNLADNVTYTFTVSATNSRNVTGPAATAYANYPGGATIGLAPSAGTASTSITVTGQLFLKNESITLYWDVSTHVAGSVVSDDNGSFTKVVKPFAGDKPKTHVLYASVQPRPHANFLLQAPPSPSPNDSPTPEESPTPTPVETPQASATRPPGGGGGINGLDIITRPPFVFLPIIGILGLLGVLAYWLLSSRRRPMAPTSASVVHHATRPDYFEPYGAPVRPAAATPSDAPFPLAQPEPAAQPSDAPFPMAQPPPQVQPPPSAPPQAPQYPAAATAPTPPAPFQSPPAAPQPPPPPAAPAPPPPAVPPRTVQWPASPHPEGAPDEPPDLPEPSD